jgi:hypothetical protein
MVNGEWCSAIAWSMDQGDRSNDIELDQGFHGNLPTFVAC